MRNKHQVNFLHVKIFLANTIILILMQIHHSSQVFIWKKSVGKIKLLRYYKMIYTIDMNYIMCTLCLSMYEVWS